MRIRASSLPLACPLRGSVPAPSESRFRESILIGKPLRAGCSRPKSFQTILSFASPLGLRVGRRDRQPHREARSPIQAFAARGELAAHLLRENRARVQPETVTFLLGREPEL